MPDAATNPFLSPDLLKSAIELGVLAVMCVSLLGSLIWFIKKYIEAMENWTSLIREINQLHSEMQEKKDDKFIAALETRDDKFIAALNNIKSS